MCLADRWYLICSIDSRSYFCSSPGFHQINLDQRSATVVKFFVKRRLDGPGYLPAGRTKTVAPMVSVDCSSRQLRGQFFLPESPWLFGEILLTTASLFHLVPKAYHLSGCHHHCFNYCAESHQTVIFALQNRRGCWFRFGFSQAALLLNSV